MFSYIFFYDFSVGGSIKEDITSCLKVFRGHALTEKVLECTHEEADDRIFFHVNDVIKRDNFTKTAVAFSDTEVFVNAVCHFTQWIYCGLTKINKKCYAKNLFFVPLFSLAIKFHN